MRHLIDGSKLLLYRKRVPEVENSIRIIKEQCFKASKGSLITPKSIKKFSRLVKLRSLHYPVQYLCSSWPFRELDLQLKRPVLIPRYESEFMIQVLIQKVKSKFSDENQLQFVEYGCGSGALGLSLIKELQIKGTLVDIKRQCIDLTRLNALKNSINPDLLTLVEADMMNQLHLMDNYDIVISNPPYLSQSHYEKYLKRQIKRYEDRDALVAQADGMKYVDEIVKAWQKRTRKGLLMVQFDGRTLQSELQNHVVNDQYGKRRFILLQK